MASCELCGKENELKVAFVERVELRVCSNCCKYGKVVDEGFSKNYSKVKIKMDEINETVAENYFELIKNATESKKFSQKDLALKINEKESTLAKIEQGVLKPTIDLAKKLEKFLAIKLIVKEKLTETLNLKAGNERFTIGDFLEKDT